LRRLAEAHVKARKERQEALRKLKEAEELENEALRELQGLVDTETGGATPAPAPTLTAAPAPPPPNPLPGAGSIIGALVDQSPELHALLTEIGAGEGGQGSLFALLSTAEALLSQMPFQLAATDVHRLVANKEVQALFKDPRGCDLKDSATLEILQRAFFSPPGEEQPGPAPAPTTTSSTPAMVTKAPLPNPPPSKEDSSEKGTRSSSLSSPPGKGGNKEATSPAMGQGIAGIPNVSAIPEEDKQGFMKVLENLMVSDNPMFALEKLNLSSHVTGYLEFLRVCGNRTNPEGMDSLKKLTGTLVDTGNKEVFLSGLNAMAAPAVLTTDASPAVPFTPGTLSAAAAPPASGSISTGGSGAANIPGMFKLGSAHTMKPKQHSVNPSTGTPWPRYISELGGESGATMMLRVLPCKNCDGMLPTSSAHKKRKKGGSTAHGGDGKDERLPYMTSVHANTEAERLFGVTASVMRNTIVHSCSGAFLRKLIHPDDFPGFLKHTNSQTVKMGGTSQASAPAQPGESQTSAPPPAGNTEGASPPEPKPEINPVPTTHNPSTSAGTGTGTGGESSLGVMLDYQMVLRCMDLKMKVLTTSASVSATTRRR
jgi:hypothetical protein